ncbi:MAG: 2OG-Fe(II) oxygenase [Sphingomonadales bacterium]|jgi:hypothetical protein
MIGALPPVADLLAALDADGHAIIPGLLDADACAATAALFDDPATPFRSRIDMARHGFGRGHYGYFARPLPPLVQGLRGGLYPALAAQCAAAGQTRPTPLLLRYGPGDFNRLHQDLYGPLVFPLQLVVLLDRPGRDFGGGELMLVEGRPRQQSQGRVVPLRQGDAALFPVRERPVPSARGWARASMRHGVATLHHGQRRTLGIIFHDAA